MADSLSLFYNLRDYDNQFAEDILVNLITNSVLQG